MRVSSKKNKGVFVVKRNKQAEQDRVQAYFIKMYPETSEKLKLQKKPVPFYLRQYRERAAFIRLQRNLCRE